MYTILMNKYKQLYASEKTMIYQREKLVDKIQFLFNEEYDGEDLSDYTAILKYVDANNTIHTELLEKDEELYKETYLRYVLPIDTDFSTYCGNVKLRVTFTKTESETLEQKVLHTSEYNLTIHPVKDYYEFIPDESLETIDQLVGRLDAKIKSLDMLATTYESTKVDDLYLSDDKLQVSAKGTPIGDGVTLNNLGMSIGVNTSDTGTQGVILDDDEDSEDDED